MKYNYPVKYTAMPIIEQVGWSHGINELERKYDIVCYIVSKCYLISDRTKYKENGKKEKDYEVVFPYQKGQYYNVWERSVPSFNNGCTNSEYVEKVFDTYEDALKFATQKNDELCKNLNYLPYTEDFNNQVSQKKQEFNDRLSRYKLLEQQILSNTKGLEQSNVKELDKLIINNKGKMQALSCDLYEYLNYSTNSNFIVYSLSQEQYNQLLTSINTHNLSEISNVTEKASPILYCVPDAKERKIKVINNNGDILYYINEWGSLIGNNEQKSLPVELNSKDRDTICLFTTETLEDILLSFNQIKYLNINYEQGPVLKKSLFDKKRK